jgi:hypothetical protein
MRKILIVSALAMTGIFVACSKSDGGGGGGTPTPPSCTTTQSFSTTVNAIIQGNCTNAGCHNATSTNGPGALTTYQKIFDNRTAIRSAVQSGLMPKNGSLSSTQKSAILCWIDQGAPNN